MSLKAIRARVLRVLPDFPDVAAAYVFGSALGECRPDSDVDVGLVVGRAIEVSPDFSPWGLEGRADAALGWIGRHPCHATVLARNHPVFAMEALRGRLVYCADEEALADFIEFVARRYPDAERRWRQAVDEVLAPASAEP